MFGFNKNFLSRSAALFLAAASLHLGSSPALRADVANTPADASSKEELVEINVDGKVHKVSPEVANYMVRQNQELLRQNLIQGTEEKESAGPAFDDLTSAELTSTFLNFEVAREGDNPTRITLYGMVFDDCLAAGKMQIRNTKTDPAFLGREPGIAGFAITDNDQAGRKCMAEHIRNHDICGKKFSCTSIDQLHGSVLVLNEKDDFKIKFGHLDPNQSRRPIQWEDFPEPQADYKGLNTRSSEEGARLSAASAARKEKKERFFKILESQAKTCRKTHDDRLVALEAAEILEGEGLKTAEEVEKIKREINRAELRDLTVRLSKAKDEVDIADAVSELKEFAENNPDSADSVARLLHQKAGLIAKAGRTPESYDHAEILVTEAKDITGISDATSKYLDADQLGIKVGRYQAMARSPNSDPYEFWNGYSSMMWDLQSQVSDCYSGGYNQSCNGSMQAFSAAMKIPQMAQQAAYERQMFQMQMQQQMNAAFGQWGGNFTPGGNFVGSPNMGMPSMGMQNMGMPNMNMGMNMNAMGGAGFGGGSPFFQ